MEPLSLPGDEYLTEIPENATSQDLSKFLHDVCFGIVNKTRPIDPLFLEVCHRLDEFPGETEESKEGERFAKSMSGFFGPQAMAGMATYWFVRDRVRNYQETRNISGVVDRVVKICGKEITIKEHDEQLCLIEGDSEITKQSVFPVVKLFCSLVADLSFDLFFKPDDDTWDPVDTEAVWLTSNNAWQVSIREESIKWGPARADGSRQGFSVDRNPPDRITLGLAVGDPSDDEWLYFEAENPNMED